jgi:hypothetical protein
MRLQRRSTCDGFRRAMCAVLVPLAAMVLTFCAAAAPARAQSDGHSYLRIKIGGYTITNYVENKRYTGWLQIEGVGAKSDAPFADEKSHVSPTDPSWHPNEKDRRPWTDYAAIVHSGRTGSGRFSFGAEDGGEMQSLIDAQKHKSLIASAELDLYDEESGAFIGKYRIRGIHVLSLEDVQASACAMYEITMSFRSVQKI